MTRQLFRLALVAVLAGLAGAAAAQQVVATYHGSADRGGLYVTPALTWKTAASVHIDAGFAASVSGAVYAQPLYWLPQGEQSGLVIVATEMNMVYALQAATGKVVWQRALGTPVSKSQLPCGNIDPIGVTGTPVIDPLSETLYLNALVSDPSGPHHKIFAVALATGKILAGWPVNVETGVQALSQPFTSKAQGQRSGLTIVNGQLYVTYGGNWGDCSTYHGTVVELALGTSTPAVTAVWETRAAGGGIWGQSGIAYDGSTMFVTTGNTMGTTTWGDGEAVIRLQPGLKHSTLKADHFAPQDWHTLDQDDLDLGGTGPIPIDVPVVGGGILPRVLQLGKDGNAYLLDRYNFNGIGGQLKVRKVSTSEIISAATRFSSASAVLVAFVGPGAACPAGQSGNLTVLRITEDPKPWIATAWCAGLNGNGAPIVTTTDGHTDPIVWVAGANGDGLLHGFRGTDGAPLFSGGPTGGPMQNLQRNATILVAEGRFYIAGTGTVYAFTY